MVVLCRWSGIHSGIDTYSRDVAFLSAILREHGQVVAYKA